MVPKYCLKTWSFETTYPFRCGCFSTYSRDGIIQLEVEFSHSMRQGTISRSGCFGSMTEAVLVLRGWLQKQYHVEYENNTISCCTLMKNIDKPKAKRAKDPNKVEEMTDTEKNELIKQLMEKQEKADREKKEMGLPIKWMEK